jgi:hypothetical protein
LEKLSQLFDGINAKLLRAAMNNELKHLYQYLCQLSSRNWFKSGMNHAQSGNLLKNLVQ